LIPLILATQTVSPHPPVQTYDIPKINEKTLSHWLFLNTISNQPNHCYYAADLDGDGISEMVIKQYTNTDDHLPSAILFSEIYGESLLHQRTQIQKCLVGNLKSSLYAKDLTGDGHMELCFSTQHNDTVTCHIINNKGEALAHFSIGNPQLSTRPWDSDICATEAADLNGDGHLDLLLTLATTYAYQPRGVIAYDFKNRRILWRHDVGFKIVKIFPIDIDDDGTSEFLISNCSPDNAIDAVDASHRRINGTSDAHSYLYIIDNQGRCLLNQPVTDQYGYLRFSGGDTDNDGKTDFYALISNRQQPYMAKLNLEKRVLIPILQLETRWVEILKLVDINRDGADELLLAWNDGMVEIRDAQLNILNAVQLNHFTTRQMEIVELHNDGFPTLILEGNANDKKTILCLNRNLELIALTRDHLSFANTPYSLFNFGYGEKKRLLLKGEKGTYLGHLKRQLVLPFKVPWLWIFGTAVVCGLTAFFIALYNHRRHHCLVQTISPIFHSMDSGLCLIDNQGILTEVNATFADYFRVSPDMLHGRAIHGVLEDNQLAHLLPALLNLLENPPESGEIELSIPYRGKMRHMLISVSNFDKGRNNETPQKQLLFFKDISHVVESKRAVAWASMAQKLAHEIKTPLSTVMLSAQRLQAIGGSQDNRQEKYLKHIIDQVDRLRELTDSLLKFARIEKSSLQQEDINKIIQESVRSFQLVFGRGIKLITAYTPALPEIAVDRQQLLMALNNLISNALKAMEGQGTLHLATRLTQDLRLSHQEMIQIEINDTGKGIDAEAMNRLFEPFFTQSPGGTGLGLAIVKKIIDDHEGRIHIQSQPGLGTAVTVSLPVQTPAVS